MSVPYRRPEKEIPNDHVAESANQFRDAANLLFREMLRLNCVSPVLVNAAFAIELFLKSLNAKNVYHPDSDGLGYLVTAQPEKGHSLVKLYEGLDTEVQGVLQKFYGAWERKGKASCLKEALTLYDTIFVDWRYPFEGAMKNAGGSINGLIDLMNFFGRYVNVLRDAGT